MQISKQALWFSNQWLFSTSNGTLKISAIKTPFRRDVLYLTRSIYSASAAELLWRVPAGAVRYQVFRDGQMVATVTGGSYLDTTLDDGGDFQFEVIALDANNREILRGTYMDPMMVK